MLNPLAVIWGLSTFIGPPRPVASEGDESVAIAKRVGLGSSGSSSRGAVVAGWDVLLCTTAWATATRSAGCAATTVEGATIWLTRATTRQATHTAELIRMSRTEFCDGVIESLTGSVQRIALVLLLFETIDPSSPFIQFALAGQAEILQRIGALHGGR